MWLDLQMRSTCSIIDQGKTQLHFSPVHQLASSVFLTCNILAKWSLQWVPISGEKIKRRIENGIARLGQSSNFSVAELSTATFLSFHWVSRMELKCHTPQERIFDLARGDIFHDAIYKYERPKVCAEQTAPGWRSEIKVPSYWSSRGPVWWLKVNSGADLGSWMGGNPASSCWFNPNSSSWGECQLSLVVFEPVGIDGSLGRMTFSPQGVKYSFWPKIFPPFCWTLLGFWLLGFSDDGPLGSRVPPPRCVSCTFKNRQRNFFSFLRPQVLQGGFCAVYSSEIDFLLVLWKRAKHELLRRNVSRKE